MYVSNPRNADFSDLLFDGDQRLITRRQIYRVNDDIVESLENDLILDGYCWKTLILLRLV